MNQTFLTIFLVASLTIGLATTPSRAADATTPAEPAASDTTVLIEPGVNWVKVKGNAAKFREDTWMKDGVTGGIEQFQMSRKVGKDLELNIEGRGIFDAHDYKLQLELIKPEYWFLRSGYTEYYKYFNGNGGYYTTNRLGSVFVPQDADLHLDMRNFFIEAGILRPNLPKITIGYERQEKEGLKSMLEWGTANFTNTTTKASSNKKIWPSYKAIDEQTDIIRLEAEYDIKNIHLGNEFRYERYQARNVVYDTTTGYLSPYRLPPFSGPSSLNRTNATATYTETFKNDLFWNTFHADCHVNEKFYWSLGYLFTSFGGDDGFDRTVYPDPLGTSHIYTTGVDVNSHSHVLNGNVMYDICKSLTAHIGVQAEMTDQDAIQSGITGTNVTPLVFLTSVDKRSMEENAGLRWTAIPFTTVYADIKLAQEQFYYDYSLSPAQHDITLRDTQQNTQRQSYKIGFNSSPLPRMTVSGYYRHGVREDDFDSFQEFVISQKFVTDEYVGKLTLRPCSRVALSFKYQYLQTDVDNRGTYTNATTASGRYNSSVYTVSATITPINRLYLTGLFSYQDTTSSTYLNNVKGLDSYRGDVYTALTSATYAFDNKTDLTAEYSFSYADNANSSIISGGGYDFGMDYSRHGIQVGIRRQLAKNVVANLRYGYFEYVENNTGGINNYRANMVSASCAIRF